MDRFEQIIKLIEANGMIRPRDVESEGIPRVYLQRLYERGQVERVGRGLYTLPDALITEHDSLVEVAQRVPTGVICLLSALHFYSLTTQLPHRVWIAIEGTSWKPRMDYPPLEVMRFSGNAFHYGVEVHEINQVTVPIYSIAKTIADCFKFRNKIGLDVALEALREGLADKRTSVDAIWQAAKVCRVANVMRPYMEAIS